MTKYVVRFQATPLNYTRKEACLVEAETAVDAVLAVTDMLIRRGDDPAAFLPCRKVVKNVKEMGTADKWDQRYIEEGKTTLEEVVKKNDEYRKGLIEKEIAEWVEVYKEPPVTAKILSFV